MTIQHKQNPLQYALFQAAKVGNFNLMRELIKAGANPFSIDESGRSALSYAVVQDREATAALFSELNSKWRGRNVQ